MSDNDIIANLRKRYAEPEIPPCRVCGRKLSLGAIVHGTKFWYCDTDDLRHWAQSEVVRQFADPDVIALCDEVERLRTIISEVSKTLDAEMADETQGPSETCAKMWARIEEAVRDAGTEP